MMDDPRAGRIVQAITLWAVDPSLGGIWLRARPSPVRDDVMRLVRQAIGSPLTKIHPSIGDEALFGGLDITATLAAGRPMETTGILNTDDPKLHLAQAQSISAALAARLGSALDHRTVAVAVDEGLEDEGLVPSLQDRLAFHIDLEGLRYDALQGTGIEIEAIAAAKANLSKISVDGILELVTELAAQFGITSLRAIQFALRAAKAAAALDGMIVEECHIADAAALVFGPRAVPMDMIEEQAQPEDTPKEERDSRNGMLDDQIIEAVKANLPTAALLAFLNQQRAQRQMGGHGAGSRKKGNRRGRPIAPRPGQLSNGARLDILATLRRAVPWQGIREGRGPIALRPQDFAIKRFEEQSDRLIVFSVDASGSSAAKRLGEAKGAVETLLAEAYARRDHVALIAFRKDGAEVLLPPTRSLVQAKKRLGDLPGGGGTPLASGLQAGFMMSLAARKKGMSPAMVLLSDGGANIALDGSPGRPKAQADAEDIARHFAVQNLPCLTVDTGRRPDNTLQKVATQLGGGYFPLPNADSNALAQTLKSGLFES
ncbi:MAG: VWA domain-containing protein [Pseudomonadota bacterium]